MDIAPRPGLIHPAEPGTPYHRLGRTAGHRWWQPLVGTAVVLGGAVTAIVALLSGSVVVAFATGTRTWVDGLPTASPLVELAVTLASLGLITPFVLAAARGVQARPAGTVSSVLGRLRWGWLGRCLLLAVPTVGLMIAGIAALLVATGEPLDDGLSVWVGLGPFLASAALLLVLVPFQAAAEEYVCRGWLLQAVGSFLRTPWLPIAVQAVVFGAAHGWGTWWGFADLVVFGVVLGWLTIRTGGLEAAIALHVVNNLVAMGLAAAFGALDSTETAADAPWQMFVVDVPVFVGFALVVSWLARRRRIDAVSPDPKMIR
ncbi:type II CAAX endopeptidase family protein [Solwaraspora sp. WMMD1047]|uniref:CPBP family intramembrane glutamic endopeptidase n=1 Tax=Solwaraspora sp. WMMD1047 TaxID=3016102 RepID=UPI0024170B0E|nr:type II CAAX endopeptidase family protein [Solwaraspora sp. WMMD1047]MDG4833740.1 type II CAAX endopeptidase family protein [Solwaraspora sp. WMMD1047]